MVGVILIGGGREDAQVRASHAPFVAGSVRAEGRGSAYRVAPRDGAVVVSVQP